MGLFNFKQDKLLLVVFFFMLDFSQSYTPHTHSHIAYEEEAFSPVMTGHKTFKTAEILGAVGAIRQIYSSLPEVRRQLVDELAGSPQACAQSAASDSSKGLPISLLKLIILEQPDLCLELYDSYEAVIGPNHEGERVLNKDIPIWPVVSELYKYVVSRSDLNPDKLPTRIITDDAVAMRICDFLILQYINDKDRSPRRPSHQLMEQYFQKMMIPPVDIPYTPTTYIYDAIKTCDQMLQNEHDLGDLSRSKYDQLQSARKNIGKIKKKTVRLALLIESTVLRRLLLLKIETLFINEVLQTNLNTTFQIRAVLDTIWQMALCDMHSLLQQAKRLEKDVQAKGLCATSSEEVLQIWTKIWSSWGLGSCTCLLETSSRPDYLPKTCVKCLAQLQEADVVKEGSVQNDGSTSGLLEVQPSLQRQSSVRSNLNLVSTNDSDEEGQ